MAIELSQTQRQALSKIKDWYFNQPDKQFFKLFGYAGTGKSAIAKTIAENLGVTVRYGAFTGKAAHVMKLKGCTNAATIHSMIYNPEGRNKSSEIKKLELELIELQASLMDEHESYKTDAKFIELSVKLTELKTKSVRPRFTLDEESTVKQAGLIVVDECSMVDEKMALDLLSFNVKVLVLGDPAQLPPVGGNGFFIKGKADYQLTEIFRQASGNGILDLATLCREGKPLPLGDYGGSRVAMKSELQKEVYLSADQIIVGKNETRNAFNRRMRDALGYHSKYPEASEKIICLKNNVDMGLLNGSMWKITEVHETDEENCIISIEDEFNTKIENVKMVSHYFLNKPGKPDWWDKTDAQEFDYGYAITCHKSQGSQWDNVVVIDESSIFRQSSKEWLYTAITRAAKNVTIVRS